jgi:hypothetical protein
MYNELIDLLAEMFATIIIERSGVLQDVPSEEEKMLDGLFMEVDLGT